jgi:hypothetical protein
VPTLTSEGGRASDKMYFGTKLGMVTSLPIHRKFFQVMEEFLQLISNEVLVTYFFEYLLEKYSLIRFKSNIS